MKDRNVAAAMHATYRMNMSKWMNCWT